MKTLFPRRLEAGITPAKSCKPDYSSRGVSTLSICGAEDLITSEGMNTVEEW